MGIASAGGAGKALAEWIVQGEPTLDLWPVDIRRFARFNGNESWLPDRVTEVLGLHYKMPWPNRELDSARPFRRSPLYDRPATTRAPASARRWAGSGRTCSRPRRPKPRDRVRLGPPELAPVAVAEEHRACRERVALFDMISFAKLLVQGPDAGALQRPAGQRHRGAGPAARSTPAC